MRIFLGLMALVWLPYGLWCFAAPDYLAEAAGVTSLTPTGSTELRAMYGGLQAGIGLLAAVSLVRVAWAPSALLALAFLGGGLGGFRLAGAVLDGSWSGYTLGAIAFELAILAVSVTLLRRSPGPVPATASS